MTYIKGITVDSPIGRLETDHTGSPIGVAHLDTNRSYADIGPLLKTYINNGDQEAWRQIKSKIDYTYKALGFALDPLNGETGFGREVKTRVAQGQKLLFKPNLVSPCCIHPQTHQPDFGTKACTEWAFVAALMRWFHDQLGISYHQMAVGEASILASTAGFCTLHNPEGQMVTTEAVIEGRAGPAYGGWGFYFARQYLAESLGLGQTDDPMNGYEESVAGAFIPPGLATDKLMVYDLNRIYDDPTKGREIPVPDGINFQTITLHKAVVGGDPDNPDDRKAYPGCVLINVPKLKVHSITLITSAIKNLGIGLYPMQAADDEHHRWKYAVPPTAVPGQKGLIPHQVWVTDVDAQSGLPNRDSAGNYIVRKTGGISATMADIISAVNNQDIFSVHVVDAIEAINLDHTASLPGTKHPEGLVFASLDPVASDLLCARYLFNNISLREAVEIGLDDGSGGHFSQKVPVPTVESGNIVSRVGYDCPLARDTLPAYNEGRGLGRRQYYVLGSDVDRGLPIVSLQGHLGTVVDGTFSDIIATTLYLDASKVPWDLQLTSFKYMQAVDELTGSSLFKSFLDCFDENGDGIIDFDEFGKKGFQAPGLYLGALQMSLMGSEPLGFLRGNFAHVALTLKYSEPAWNTKGIDLTRESLIGTACHVAYLMSQMPADNPDPFCPSLTWGNGRWPSFQLAWHHQLGTRLYGRDFPSRVEIHGLYGTALSYADLTQNDGRYVGKVAMRPVRDAASRYVEAVLSGEAKPLDFTFFVPPGYGRLGNSPIPNVEETTDPAKVLTATFAGGKEVWPDTRFPA